MARILIIDDDEQIRTLLGGVFGNAQHEIFEAENGKVGMDVMQKQSADLVITDLIMDVQDGLQTIIQLRRYFPAVRILAISGGGGDPNRNLQVASELGAHRTLAKPFSIPEIRRTVHELLAEPAPGNCASID